MNFNDVEIEFSSSTLGTRSPPATPNRPLNPKWPTGSGKSLNLNPNYLGVFSKQLRLSSATLEFQVLQVPTGLKVGGAAVQAVSECPRRR